VRSHSAGKVDVSPEQPNVRVDSDQAEAVEEGTLAFDVDAVGDPVAQVGGSAPPIGAFVPAEETDRVGGEPEMPAVMVSAECITKVWARAEVVSAMNDREPRASRRNDLLIRTSWPPWEATVAPCMGMRQGFHASDGDAWAWDKRGATAGVSRMQECPSHL
jgi:hypothetical protein